MAPIARDRLLRERYGITLAQYEALFARQGGVCRICARPSAHQALEVDHCHRSGRVRGLLCGPCNRALGLFEDDPARLVAAACYLEAGEEDEEDDEDDERRSA